MKFSLLLRPEATEEIDRAFQWYERQRLGLGDEFLEAVRKVLTAVEEAPLRLPIIRGRARRALLGRFPYSVLFFIDGEFIVVFACFHGKRDPRRWHRRS